jgi:hypothetical protein
MSSDCGRVKIYPLIGIAAWRAGLGGAFRTWIVARSISGNGRVLIKDIKTTLRRNGVSQKNAYRWTNEAINAGFFRVNGNVVYYADVVQVCKTLDVGKIGIPVEIALKHLLKKGWRSLVWAGYVCTLKERPFSQKTKEITTGISPRVQRLYQAAQPGTKRMNLAETGLQPDQIRGMIENENGYYFAVGRKVYKKLPDIRSVPTTIAVLARPGQTRKIQQTLNACDLEAQAPSARFRLFHTAHQSTDNAIRTLNKTDMLPWHLPMEIFQRKSSRGTVNFWDVIPTGAQIW